MTVQELIDQLSNLDPDKQVKVLYLRPADQLWEYRIVNIGEDLLGANLIVESARKLLSEKP